jgi:hypothetical protein
MRIRIRNSDLKDPDPLLLSGSVSYHQQAKKCRNTLFVQLCDFLIGNFLSLKQCFGSGSELDPDFIRLADPDPGGQKLTTKVEKS